MTRPVLGIYTPILHLPQIHKILSQHFDILYYPDLTYAEALENIGNVEYIFTNPNKLKFKFDSKLLENACKLKLFATASTGQDHVDINFLQSKKIKFISLRSHHEVLEKLTSTSELAFLFLMSYARKYTQALQSVKQGEWDYQKFVGNRIQDLRIGVIGFGRLGKIFSNYCHQFGANVGIYDPYVTIDPRYLKYTSLEGLFKDSDVISIHAHLDSTTKNLIDLNLLNLTKSNFGLINTSRGAIVNETDICKWIDKAQGHFYLTDVVTDELNDNRKSELIEKSVTSGQIIVTPHIGGMTLQGQIIAYKTIANEILNYSNTI